MNSRPRPGLRLARGPRRGAGRRFETLSNVRTSPSNLVLAYQRADDAQREVRDRFWGSLGDAAAYLVVWGVVGTLVAALLGSVVLWGILIANAAR